MLREISKERGVPIIWNEGRFQDQFKRKTLSIDPSLTTSHAHVMFSNTLKPEDVVEVGVMYEQLRDGRDRPLVDGIEFRFDHEDAKKTVLGRRHGNSTGSQSNYWFKDGDILTGFVVFLSDEPGENEPKRDLSSAAGGYPSRR